VGLVLSFLPEGYLFSSSIFLHEAGVSGAAGGVTGSHTVLEANDSRIGIDAGFIRAAKE